MEQLVGRYDFMTAALAQRKDFSSELRHNNDMYTATTNEEDILGALKILRKAVCCPHFPGESSDQCYFAKDVLEQLMQRSEGMHDSGKIKTRDRIHEFCFDLLKDLISQGPGTGHVVLIVSLLSDSGFGFKEYYENLRGDKLKEYLHFLKREYQTHETGKDKDRFKIAIEQAFRFILDTKTFTDEACEEARAEFIELYLYMELSFLTRSESDQYIYHRVAMSLYYKYDRNVFQGVDVSILKRSLKYLENMICHTNLTTAKSDNIVKRIRSVLGDLLSAVDVVRFTKMHTEIMDFVITVCDKKAGSPVHTFVETVGYFYYHVKDDKNNPVLKGNSVLFSEMTTKLTHFLTTLEDHTVMRVRFTDAAVNEVLVVCIDTSPEHRRLIIGLVVACIRINQPYVTKAALWALRGCGKTIRWKEHLDDAVEILDVVSKTRVYGNDKREKENHADIYKNVCAYLAEQIKRDRLVPKIVDTLVDFYFKVLEKRDPYLFEAANEVANIIELVGKKNKDLIMSIYPRLLPILEDPQFPWRKVQFSYADRTVTSLALKATQALDSKIMKPEDYTTIGRFIAQVLKGDFIDPDTNEPTAVYYQIFACVGITYLTLLDDHEKMQRSILLIREIVNLLSHDYKEVVMIVTSQIQILVGYGARVMAPFFQKLLDVYIDKDYTDLLYSLRKIYPYNPTPLEPHFQTIFELIDGGQKSSVLPWITDIAKKQPHLFTGDNISRLVQELQESDDMYQSLYLLALVPLSRTMPERVEPHLQTLMDVHLNTQLGTMNMMAQVLKNVAIMNEDNAEAVMAYFEKRIQGPDDDMVTPTCLNEMRAIGGVYRHLLEKRKPAIEELRNKSTIQTNKDRCTNILDILEGRSLESLSVEIAEVKEDVEELDVRVTETELGLILVNQEVDHQKQELGKVKVEVKEHGEKIGQLEESVDETKAKVQDIDGKTLSHAPFWSRDVAKLINPLDLLDWRLLSSRLGYCNDDIRSWSQMHDPCMSMLNEWYATRKTKEATFAVLTALQEMDRTDAAVIVENAMKMAETVVEDEAFEYVAPPEVFLSYQWGIQDEVKLLKQHLEKAGFTCWMDIGQMGGGDKLFEKIDQGVRAAKVIISCVTEKYAKSPNCNREVNLSTSLGKPIIPLLMEKMSWPPPGAMGPIFSEYLFIRFFTRQGEETGDDRYWSAAKFQELLMQLNYNNIKPDEGKVHAEYKDWWCPMVEVIKIEKKDVQKQTEVSRKKQEQVESGSTSPDVFISYQWGKQKQIQVLYKRLTELGFTCWMDIYQMGGGDSLYDKIDKGVRGAKVVLSCITTKYSLSANCRREVSLADALKKPIVPLLMERMTWPPSGPMSMVFTQLLYITFAKDESVQDRWDGEKFGELLTKLDEYVPDVVLLEEEGAPVTSVSNPSGTEEKKSSAKNTPPPPPPPPAAKTNDQPKPSSPQPKPDQKEKPLPREDKEAGQQDPTPQKTPIVSKPVVEKQQQPKLQAAPPESQAAPPPCQAPQQQPPQREQTQKTSKSCTIL